MKRVKCPECGKVMEINDWVIGVCLDCGRIIGEEE